jgi:hypothetical protein
MACMTDKEELEMSWGLVTRLKAELALAESAHNALFYHPKNNKFTDYQLAEATVSVMLEDLANADCEGSYNCGSPQYTQQFYVNDVLYEGVLDVEYNRHDKTYYYVEDTDFKVRKVETND